MRYLMLVALLCCASWALAQNSPSQNDPGQTSPRQTEADNTAGQTTVQGCLSSSDGNYMLTDKSGNSFQLTGDTAKLSEHVGHEVKVTGTLNSASASSGSEGNTMGQTGASSQGAIEVSSLKHIAKTCTK
jgi:hypothetical protein